MIPVHHDLPSRPHDPRWLREARALIGTQEVAGPKNSLTILGWARKLGGKVLGIDYRADSEPWCGLFLARCFAAVEIAPPRMPVRANSWANWGRALRPERVAPGAVLVFERQGGGHVGLYVGEDEDSYSVLGGNQNDSVSIARIAKARCIARRWPEGEPVVGRPQTRASAAPASKSEA